MIREWLGEQLESKLKTPSSFLCEATNLQAYFFTALLKNAISYTCEYMLDLNPWWEFLLTYKYVRVLMLLKM